MMTFKWFIELFDQEQEFLTGGSLPQISNNNFSQRAENTTDNNSTTPLGKVSRMNTDFANVNSGAQSILSSNEPEVSPFGSVNNLFPNNPRSFNNPLGTLGMF
ncbi:CTB family bacteriocin [Anabaena aphanizomenioides LEGE 00250]|uniref:CTB family bacteriocin n=1 Tax=Sphaerospermopsis aphanizomenoides LEGE 00250 TaxID=2777972 RepID=A0ABR9VK43_9CYAN|nr:CTB family bacteriocin [Sphaerospermopsis aphanizomenoides]MBE9237765.1 CTB family bacteriocin [Sphaerospermopsis aphanizomenoides LEGE 00250]